MGHFSDLTHGTGKGPGVEALLLPALTLWHRQSAAWAAKWALLAVRVLEQRKAMLADRCVLQWGGPGGTAGTDATYFRAADVGALSVFLLVCALLEGRAAPSVSCTCSSLSSTWHTANASRKHLRAEQLELVQLLQFTAVGSSRCGLSCSASNSSEQGLQPRGRNAGGGCLPAFFFFSFGKCWPECSRLWLSLRYASCRSETRRRCTP